MGNHRVAGVSQNTGVLVVLVQNLSVKWPVFDFGSHFCVHDWKKLKLFNRFVYQSFKYFTISVYQFWCWNLWDDLTTSYCSKVFVLWSNSCTYMASVSGCHSFWCIDPHFVWCIVDCVIAAILVFLLSDWYWCGALMQKYFIANGLDSLIFNELGRCIAETSLHIHAANFWLCN